MDTSMTTQERQLSQFFSTLPSKSRFRYTEQAERELLESLFWSLAAGRHDYIRLFFPEGRPSANLKLRDAQGGVDGSEYTEAARGKTCGHIFKPGEASYHCRTCSVDDTCCLCSRCFESTDHAGHMVRINISTGGTSCCDCGDPEAWTRPIFCTIHSEAVATPHGDDADVADACSTAANKPPLPCAPLVPPSPVPGEGLPQDLVDNMRMTISRVFDYICDVVACSPEQMRRSKTRESVEMDERLSRLSSTYYGRGCDPCNEFTLILWNDEKHTVDEVRNQVARACRTTLADGVQRAIETDSMGRSLLKFDTDLDRLLDMAKTLEKIKVTITIRSSRDTFREQMCGTMVEWLCDVANCSVGNDHKILRVLVCEEMLKEWRQGSPAQHASVGKGGLFDEERLCRKFDERHRREMMGGLDPSLLIMGRGILELIGNDEDDEDDEEEGIDDGNAGNLDRDHTGDGSADMDSDGVVFINQGDELATTDDDDDGGVEIRVGDGDERGIEGAGGGDDNEDAIMTDVGFMDTVDGAEDRRRDEDGVTDTTVIMAGFRPQAASPPLPQPPPIPHVATVNRGDGGRGTIAMRRGVRERDATPSDSDTAVERQPTVPAARTRASIEVPRTTGGKKVAVGRPGPHWLETPVGYRPGGSVDAVEDVFRRVRLDWLMLFDLRLWKKVRNDLKSLYITTVVQVNEFKRVLSLRFAGLYTALAQLYLVGDREPDHSIVNISLQMLTAPSIAAEIVERGNFLATLLAILYTFLTERQVGYPWEVSPTAVMSLDAGTAANRRMYHFYADLEYLLSSPLVQERIRSEERYLLQFLDLVKLHQGISPNKRAVTRHIEWENETWITAQLATRKFNIKSKQLAEAFRACRRLGAEGEAQLGRAIRIAAKTAILNSIGADRKRFPNCEVQDAVTFKRIGDFEFDDDGNYDDDDSEEEGRVVGKQVQGAEVGHDSDEGNDDAKKDEDINKNEVGPTDSGGGRRQWRRRRRRRRSRDYKVVKFVVENGHLSFHHGLHYTLSWLVERARFMDAGWLRDVMSFSEQQLRSRPRCMGQLVLPGPGVVAAEISAEDLLLAMFDFPLRVCAWLAQARAGMWVRNGVSLRHQALTYRSVSNRDTSYQRDLFLLQTALVVCDPGRVLASIVDRYGMDRWIKGLFEVKAEAQDDTQHLDVAEDMVHLLAVLLSDRAALQPTDRDGERGDSERAMRRDVAQVLCLKPLQFQELCNKLPESYTEQQAFHDVLERMTTFRPPEGLTDVGTFELRPEYIIDEVDPYGLHYTKQQREETDLAWRRLVASRTGRSPDDVVFEPRLQPLTEGAFCALPAFTATGMFAQIAYYCLLYPLVAQTLTPTVTVTRLETFLHLVLHLVLLAVNEDVTVGEDGGGEEGEGHGGNGGKIAATAAAATAAVFSSSPPPPPSPPPYWPQSSWESWASSPPSFVAIALKRQARSNLLRDKPGYKTIVSLLELLAHCEEYKSCHAKILLILERMRQKRPHTFKAAYLRLGLAPDRAAAASTAAAEARAAEEERERKKKAALSRQAQVLAQFQQQQRNFVAMQGADLDWGMNDEGEDEEGDGGRDRDDQDMEVVVEVDAEASVDDIVIYSTAITSHNEDNEDEKEEEGGDNDDFDANIGGHGNQTDQPSLPTGHGTLISGTPQAPIIGSDSNNSNNVNNTFNGSNSRINDVGTKNSGGAGTKRKAAAAAGDDGDEVTGPGQKKASSVSLWRFPTDTCILCQEATDERRLYGTFALFTESHIIRQTDLQDPDYVREAADTPANLDRPADAIRPFGVAGRTRRQTRFMTRARGETVVRESQHLARGFPSRLCRPGPVATGCGHMMHYSCFEAYWDATKRRHAHQIARHQPENLGRLEFVCPLCKALGNAFVPVIWRSREESYPGALYPASATPFADFIRGQLEVDSQYMLLRPPPDGQPWPPSPAGEVGAGPSSLFLPLVGRPITPLLQQFASYFRTNTFIAGSSQALAQLYHWQQQQQQHSPHQHQYQQYHHYNLMHTTTPHSYPHPSGASLSTNPNFTASISHTPNQQGSQLSPHQAHQQPQQQIIYQSRPPPPHHHYHSQQQQQQQQQQPEQLLPPYPPQLPNIYQHPPATLEAPRPIPPVVFGAASVISNNPPATRSPTPSDGGARMRDLMRAYHRLRETLRINFSPPPYRGPSTASFPSNAPSSSSPLLPHMATSAVALPIVAGDVLVHAVGYTISAVEIQQRGIGADYGQTFVSKVPESTLAHLRIISETAAAYTSINMLNPVVGPAGAADVDSAATLQFCRDSERQHCTLFPSLYVGRRTHHAANPAMDYPPLLALDPFLVLNESLFGVARDLSLDTSYLVRLCYLAELVKLVFHMGRNIPMAIWTKQLTDRIKRPTTATNEADMEFNNIDCQEEEQESSKTERAQEGGGNGNLDARLANFSAFAFSITSRATKINGTYKELVNEPGPNLGFQQPGFDSLEGHYEFVRRYALVFLRKCALLMNVKCGVRLDRHISPDPDADELSRLTEALRVPTIDDMFSSLAERGLVCGWPLETSALVRGWIQHDAFWHQQQATAAAVSVSNNNTKPRPRPALVGHPAIFELIGMPERYTVLIEEAAPLRCATTNQELSDPALCMFCGEIVCFQSKCCTVSQQDRPGQDPVKVGGCQQHMQVCQRNVGMFLNIRKCTVLFLFHRSGSFHDVPYIDKYGETDLAFRHGRELFLHQKRYDLRLRNVVLGHGIPAFVSRRLEAEINNGGWETL